MWPFKIKETVEAPLIVGTPDLGKLDELSGTWLFIKNWAEEELAIKRKLNDKPLDAEKTAMLRGEIKVLKKVANLPDVLASRDSRLNRSTRLLQAGDDDAE